MTNFERYNKLHNEVMTRLEKEEITIEQAKDVIDLAFDKYMVESGEDVEKLKARHDTLEREYKKCEAELRKLNDVDGTSEEAKKYTELENRMRTIGREMKDIAKKIDGKHMFA